MHRPAVEELEHERAGAERGAEGGTRERSFGRTGAGPVHAGAAVVERDERADHAPERRSEAHRPADRNLVAPEEAVVARQRGLIETAHRIDAADQHLLAAIKSGLRSLAGERATEARVEAAHTERHRVARAVIDAAELGA